MPPGNGQQCLAEVVVPREGENAWREGFHHDNHSPYGNSQKLGETLRDKSRDVHMTTSYFSH